MIPTMAGESDYSNKSPDNVSPTELIEKLSELKDRCEKSMIDSVGSIGNKTEIKSNECKTDDLSIHSKPNSVKRVRRQRKLCQPKKKIKLQDEHQKAKSLPISSVFRDDASSNESSYSNDSDDEPELKIIENMPKKQAKKPMVEVPDELMGLILKSAQSGIDEILEEKAKRQKLTATNVKNIIKQIITDDNVLEMVKNSVIGQPLTNYEPKLTRAKTKELFAKQIQENGEVFGSLSSFFKDSASCSPALTTETRTLITTEFPEEDDDEEYQPGADEQFFSDDESGLSRFGSPSVSVTPNSVKSTPQSVNAKTPRHTISVPTNKSGLKAVQRNLDFTKQTVQQIGSRTRSKFPMIDTPIEYIESQFKPPDITPDMYDGNDCDEVWREFLLNYVQPPQVIEELDDDPQIDPEYNLLADAEEEQSNILDIHEEMRVDKSVKIPKKEYKSLLDDCFNIIEDDYFYESELQDNSFCVDNDRSQPEKNSFYNTEMISAEKSRQPSFANFSNQVLLSEVTGIKMEDFNTGNLQPQEPQEEDSLNPPIIVTFLVPSFSEEQLKTIKYQLAIHVQLLTTSILNTDQKENMNYIVNGASNMLMEMNKLGVKTECGAPSLYHPPNLEAAIKTAQLFVQERSKQPYKEQLSSKYERNPRKKGEKIPLNENNPEKKKYQYRNDSRNLERYPKWIMDIYLISKAFPFPDYLPHGLFHGNCYTIRRGYKQSEYWLICSYLVDAHPELLEGVSWRSINKQLKQTCLKLTKTGLIYSYGGMLWRHIRVIVTVNKTLNGDDMNPVVLLLGKGQFKMPVATFESMHRTYPCSIREVAPRFLPYPFKSIVQELSKNDFMKPKPILPSLLNGETLNSIYVVQTRNGIQIILPPTTAPIPVKFITEAELSVLGATPEEQARNLFPSFNIPRSRPYQSHLSFEQCPVNGKTSSQKMPDIEFPAPIIFPSVAPSSTSGHISTQVPDASFNNNGKQEISIGDEFRCHSNSISSSVLESSRNLSQIRKENSCNDVPYMSPCHNVDVLTPQKMGNDIIYQAMKTTFPTFDDFSSDSCVVTPRKDNLPKWSNSKNLSSPLLLRTPNALQRSICEQSITPKKNADQSVVSHPEKVPVQNKQVNKPYRATCQIISYPDSLQKSDESPNCQNVATPVKENSTTIVPKIPKEKAFDATKKIAKVKPTKETKTIKAPRLPSKGFKTKQSKQTSKNVTVGTKKLNESKKTTLQKRASSTKGPVKLTKKVKVLLSPLKKSDSYSLRSTNNIQKVVKSLDCPINTCMQGNSSPVVVMKKTQEENAKVPLNDSEVISCPSLCSIFTPNKSSLTSPPSPGFSNKNCPSSATKNKKMNQPNIVEKMDITVQSQTGTANSDPKISESQNNAKNQDKQKKTSATRNYRGKEVMSGSSATGNKHAVKEMMQESVGKQNGVSATKKIDSMKNKKTDVTKLKRSTRTKLKVNGKDKTKNTVDEGTNENSQKNTVNNEKGEVQKNVPVKIEQEDVFINKEQCMAEKAKKSKRSIQKISLKTADFGTKKAAKQKKTKKAVKQKKTKNAAEHKIREERKIKPIKIVERKLLTVGNKENSMELPQKNLLKVTTLTQTENPKSSVPVKLESGDIRKIISSETDGAQKKDVVRTNQLIMEKSLINKNIRKSFYSNLKAKIPLADADNDSSTSTGNNYDKRTGPFSPRRIIVPKVKPNKEGAKENVPSGVNDSIRFVDVKKISSLNIKRETPLTVDAVKTNLFKTPEKRTNKISRGQMEEHKKVSVNSPKKGFGSKRFSMETGEEVPTKPKATSGWTEKEDLILITALQKGMDSSLLNRVSQQLPVKTNQQVEERLNFIIMTLTKSC